MTRRELQAALLRVKSAEALLERHLTRRRRDPEPPDPPPDDDGDTGPDRPPPPPDDPPPDQGTVLTGEQWPELDAPLAGKPLTYSDTTFLSSPRAGLFSGGHYAGMWEWPHPPNSDEARAGRRPINLDNAVFRPLDPNAPPGLTAKGTKWFSRAHLISGCDVESVDMANGFGASYDTPALVTAQEGHGLYWTFAPKVGSVYRFRNLRCVNMGGHAVQFVTACRWSQRFGIDVEPEAGAEVIFEGGYVENTDQAPSRGSTSLSFFDLLAETITLKDMEVHSGLGGIPYPVWGWDEDPDSAYTARGCVVQRGPGKVMRIEDGLYRQHGGRPDRACISIAGANTAILRGVEVHGDVHINGTSQPDLPYQDGSGQIYHGVNVTHRLITERCTGPGRLFVNKQLIGPLAGANRDMPTTP